jgi:hypothetical protein
VAQEALKGIKMLRWPTKIVLLAAGLYGIVLGAHGLYVRFSLTELLLKISQTGNDSVEYKLFLAIQVPSWFQSSVYWSTLKGMQSWVLPAIVTAAGFLAFVRALTLPW